MNASEVILERIKPVEQMLSVKEGLAQMFRQCFMNTLDTTWQNEPDGTSFVITGDIPAMWLRDSTAQVMHYVRFAGDQAVRDMLKGLIRRQLGYVLKDPYANAFNRIDSGAGFGEDKPARSPWVWERKYEIDSLCHPVQLAHAYYNQCGSLDFLDDQGMKAMETIVSVFEQEQHHWDSPYWFIRTNCPPSDTLPYEGKGNPVSYTGMTWSGFRPSDDACMYGYLIPANLFAVITLKRIAEMVGNLGQMALSERATILAAQIQQGIDRYGHVNHPEFGDIYAYEVDGRGNALLMDDANVPSLLALPYMGVCERGDATYLRTRKFVLSQANPYYYEGTQARGVGSPHTPRGYVWHIALAVQAMTSDDLDEITGLVRMLLNTNAGTGFMHEGFDPNDPSRFTRPWFAWANSMFGETIYSLYERGLLDEVLRRL